MLSWLLRAGQLTNLGWAFERKGNQQTLLSLSLSRAGKLNEKAKEVLKCANVTGVKGGAAEGQRWGTQSNSWLPLASSQGGFSKHLWVGTTKLFK